MDDTERNLINTVTRPESADLHHPVSSRGPRQAITQGIPPPNEGHKMGVCGISESNVGVWGETTIGPAAVHGQQLGDGVGVSGESRKGIGVYGKGKSLAGSFEGHVQITETLTVNGKKILDELAKLETRVRSIRLLYRNKKGRVRCNFPWNGVTESSAVVITAVEWSVGVPDPYDAPPGRPHLGDANVYVTNVGPYDPVGEKSGGVEFYLHVDYHQPLAVLVTITDLGPIQAQIVRED